MQLKRIKEIIQHYISGSQKESEQKAVDSWLDAITKKPLPHSTKKLQDLRDAAWQHIEARTSIPAVAPLSRATRIWRTLGGVAAVLLTGVVLFRTISNAQETRYITGPNEHKIVKLHDGTTIHLGSNTTLSIDQHFQDGDNRRVNLRSGEALFQVHRNEERPFIVENEHMHTEVLGTSFRITSAAQTNTWNIRVQTGKVRVSETERADHSYMLFAGDSLAYTKETGAVLYAQPDTPLTPLVFRDQHLHDVMQILASRYKCSVHISENLPTRHQFSGEFDADVTLSDILEIISLATGTRCYEEGGTIFVNSK